jgi:hypothetical protein
MRGPVARPCTLRFAAEVPVLLASCAVIAAAAGELCLGEECMAGYDKAALLQRQLRDAQSSANINLIAVKKILWRQGCMGSNEYPYTANLFGFGKCVLQPCSCQEVRSSSLVWGFAGKCDRAPDQIIDLVVTMRLRRNFSEIDNVSPTTTGEGVFAAAMQ